MLDGVVSMNKILSWASLACDQPHTGENLTAQAAAIML